MKVTKKTELIFFENFQKLKVFGNLTIDDIIEFFEKDNIFITLCIDQTSEPKWYWKISQFIGNPNNLSETEWYWKPPVESEDVYLSKDKCFENCLEYLIKNK